MKTTGKVCTDLLSEVLFHADEYAHAFADLSAVKVPVYLSKLISPCEHRLCCSKTRCLERSGHDVLWLCSHILAYRIIVVGKALVLRDVLIVESQAELQHVDQSHGVQNDGVHHNVRAVIRSCVDGA